MNKANYTVYMHTSPSGKRYIGITKQNVTRRWGNGCNYSKNQYFYNSILKYGWDKFKHEILYENLSQTEAELKEIELIAEYKSNDRKYGYNFTNGGERGSGAKRTNENKIERSIRMKTLWSDDEYRAKLCKSLKGKKRSEQGKKNMSKGQKGKIFSSAHREKLSKIPRKPIVQMDLYGNELEKFDSIVSALNYLGIPNYTSNISTCCSGKTKTAYGYKWRYANKES